MDTFWKSHKAEQFSIYQSANSDKESIKKIFIVRHAEFQTIMDALFRNVAKEPLRHELILGRQGSGKSTLLKRIEIEIEDKLFESYIPINLAEEQASIYRLFDLWLKVIEELKSCYSFQTDIKEYSEFNKEQSYTKYLYQQIHEFCLSKEKQLVLLLDNFDRIVENFSEDGIRLFREILLNQTEVIFIAASTRIDKHFWQNDKPFYDFFRLHLLKALTIAEVKDLLNHWAEVNDMSELKVFVSKNPGKLQNIHIFTDGLPRTLQIFTQLIIQNDFANEGVDYLTKIMDNVTPLYQGQLNSLPPQLRKTVLEMAFIWEACNTKELVEKCKMESKLISANLKTLATKGVVDKIETGKRNLLYRISERFFNIWLIMTQGNPEQKQKIKCLYIFLEKWYDAACMKNIEQISIPAEIRDYKKIIEFSNAIKNEDDGFDPFDFGNISRIQSIYSETENYFLSEIKKGKVASMFNLGNFYIKQSRFEEAEKYYLLAIEQGHINAMYNLGLLYTDQENFDKAEKYYSLAIERGQVSAMYNLGLLYDNQGKFEEAENYYLQAIEKGHEKAMFNWGNKHVNKGKIKDAEKYYLQAIEKGHVNTMYHWGNLCAKQGKLKKAEKYYLLAAEKGHATAIYNLGIIYNYQNKFSEAEKYYLLAMEKGHENAMSDLGLLYDNQGAFEMAEKYYLSAMEKNHINAFYNIASLYYRQNVNKVEALEYIRRYGENNVLRIIIELWNGILNEVEKRILTVIKESNFLNWFIIDLLIHQQKILVLNLFTHPEVGQMLRDKIKVLYYVCLIINKKTNNNLILKTPPEIQTSIDEILTYITKKEKFYGYKK